MNGHSRSNKIVSLAQLAMAVRGIIDCFENISVGVPTDECFDHFAILYHHKAGELLCSNINLGQGALLGTLPQIPLVRVVRLERTVSWSQRKLENFFGSFMAAFRGIHSVLLPLWHS